MPSARFNKILIANRGEIAVRVISACKELGIQTVAVYSEADRYSSHVRFADQAICIGPAKSARSYLDIASIISAAEITDVDAIHPGYGFLSENAGFAEVCEASGIKFIGPQAGRDPLMGVKERARAFMREMGVPVLPGSPGVLKTAEEGAGTGRGDRLPGDSEGFGGRRRARHARRQQARGSAARSSRRRSRKPGAAFSSADVYLEKYIGAPRHIEFQILADEHGNVEILGERECSIQRRHQKLIEESPSPAVTDAQRAEISAALRKAIARGGLHQRRHGGVPHGRNRQALLHRGERARAGGASGDRVRHRHRHREEPDPHRAGRDAARRFCRGRSQLRGHAIECRINAENPETFAPSPGRITGFHLPGGIGVRVDTWAYTDCVIPPYYDSLVAKLIAYGSDRAEAIRRMQRALEMFIVEGIHTSIPLHQRILADPDFQAGRFDTNFIATKMK